MLKGREEVLGSHLGKRRAFKANLSRMTEDKILLTQVTDLETNETFDHLWIDRPHFDKKYGVRRHFKITFTAVVTEYLGIDEDFKQGMKNGVTKVSKVRYIYKLRKSQRI